MEEGFIWDFVKLSKLTVIFGLHKVLLGDKMSQKWSNQDFVIS